MPAYKLIGHPRSRALRVMWMLDELGEEYAIVAAPPQSDQARAANPSGKIPALEVDGEVLIESVAIVQYLADAHGEFTFPAGTIARARQDAFTQFCVDEVESALWTATKHGMGRLPEGLNMPGIKASCQHEFDQALRALETRLGDNAYVMGDRFTVPDILLGHCAGWAKLAMGWDLPDGAVGAYFQRLRQRPAFKRTQRRAVEVIAAAEKA